MVDSRDLDAVRALLERRRKDLLAQYKAAGVGVGRHGDDYVIVVYLMTADQQPRTAETVEGVSIRFEVTGPFKTTTNR